ILNVLADIGSLFKHFLKCLFKGSIVRHFWKETVSTQLEVSNCICFLVLRGKNQYFYVWLLYFNDIKSLLEITIGHVNIQYNEIKLGFVDNIQDTFEVISFMYFCLR